MGRDGNELKKIGKEGEVIVLIRRRKWEEERRIVVQNKT